MTTTSQRDVVFTPFMLRVREAAEAGPHVEPSAIRFEPSGTCAIAVAVDEWFELRAYAEHMIAEANAMLDSGTERIALRDEYGTDVLAFELGWKGHNFRLFVHTDSPGHTAHIEVGDDLRVRPEKPAELRVLDDLIINMLIRAGRLSGAERPEIGESVVAAGIRTNYLEAGTGQPVVFIHGSGPGVTAYANWRLTIPDLAKRYRVLAPDMVGFGYTERPKGVSYDLQTWADHIVGFLDALSIPSASLVGNSFGGAIALRVAVQHPDRVDRLVLMGSIGVRFPITVGLDAVWGYQPSVENMRQLLDVFAYSRELVNDELANLRYRASIEPGFQESFSAMFPEPRQRHIDAMATPEDQIARLPHETLIIHGRDDQVIPLRTSLRLLHLIDRSQLHVFGRCGHWTQIEHSAEFNRLLDEFLAG